MAMMAGETHLRLHLRAQFLDGPGGAVLGAFLLLYRAIMHFLEACLEARLRRHCLVIEEDPAMVDQVENLAVKRTLAVIDQVMNRDGGDRRMERTGHTAMP